MSDQLPGGPREPKGHNTFARDGERQNSIMNEIKEIVGELGIEYIQEGYISLNHKAELSMGEATTVLKPRVARLIEEYNQLQKRGIQESN